MVGYFVLLCSATCCYPVFWHWSWLLKRHSIPFRQMRTSFPVPCRHVMLRRNRWQLPCALAPAPSALSVPVSITSSQTDPPEDLHMRLPEIIPLVIHLLGSGATVILILMHYLCLNLNFKPFPSLFPAVHRAMCGTEENKGFFMILPTVLLIGWRPMF